MKVIVGKTVKVGVGKFESVDVYASFETDVNSSAIESVVDAYKACWEIVDKQLNEQILQLQDIVKPDSVFLIKRSTGNKQKRST